MKKIHWWLMGTCSVAALGAGTYFLFFRQKDKTGVRQYGNRKRKSKNNKRSGDRDGSIQTTKSGQGTSVNIPDWNNPYDMNYAGDVKRWIKPQQVYDLKPEEAKKLARQLKEAYGGAWYANDDEEAVKSVFAKKLKDKVQVSALSKAFWDTYQKDMWEYLAHFLSDSEMEEYVHKPVKKLPNYRIIK